MDKRRHLLGLLIFSLVLLTASGCTRRFFRKRADKEVDGLLAEKDQVLDWKIEQYHVYPDPRARFADIGKTDRPPMPPDDPTAQELSPNPQKPPHKAGVALMEGDGYMQLLAEWDAENRASAPPAKSKPAPASPSSATYRDPLESRNAPTPYRLKLEQSIELGIVNSRQFQDRREDLYLTALPVTVERFAFSTQFFATEEVIRERLGSLFPGGPANRWVANTNTGFSKLFSTGALLLFKFANRTVVEMGNRATRRTISESSIDLDLMQPLLRGGGHAVTLEPLTLTERNLLYEIRDYARFRKEFFVALAAGADIGGISVGTTRFRNRPPTFGGGNLVPGSSVPLGRGFLQNLPASEQVQPSGYLPVVLNASLLENERQNVANLENILKLFEGFKEGGDLAQLQVDRVEQQLLQGRSTAFTRDQLLRDSLDRFKLQLGVPANLPLELDDQPIVSQREGLRRFEQIIEEFDEVRKQAAELYKLEEPAALRSELLKLAENSKLVQGTAFRKDFAERLAEWSKRTSPDLLLRRLAGSALMPAGAAGFAPLAALAGLSSGAGLGGELSRLRAELRELQAQRDDLESKNKPLPAELLNRIDTVTFDIEVGRFEQSLRAYEAQPLVRLAGAALMPAEATGFAPLAALAGLSSGSGQVRGLQALTFRDVFNDFEVLLLAARNDRVVLARKAWPTLPRLCAEGVDLMTAGLEEAETVVTRTALSNRFDLMNVRAQLVDSWRQIAVAANSLLGTFNVEYHLNSLTPPGLDHPFAFSGSRTRHQLTFKSELPLVRILERNVYRASLIGFQRERRILMAAEDAIASGVRSQLRQLRVLAENYKIQQRAVELAYLQVENALDTFRAPPIPSNQPLGAGNAAGNNAALTQQLLEAQSNLIRAQNALVNLWVQYLTSRMQLYRDLEMMPLDSRGVWTDDVATCHCPDSPEIPDGTAAPAPRLVPEGAPDAGRGTGGAADLGSGSGHHPAGVQERAQGPDHSHRPPRDARIDRR